MSPTTTTICVKSSHETSNSHPPDPNPRLHTRHPHRVHHEPHASPTSQDCPSTHTRPLHTITQQDGGRRRKSLISTFQEFNGGLNRCSGISDTGITSSSIAGRLRDSLCVWCRLRVFVRV
ncbi:hypothetical protein Droror1_Dr00016454 [Drosera rotundifolia]